jgi:hypothetical protein
MIKIRAIYKGDILYNSADIFELNKETGYFHMLNDFNFRYEKNIVLNDDDWVIFEIENEKVSIITH